MDPAKAHNSPVEAVTIMRAWKLGGRSRLAARPGKLAIQDGLAV